jgi:DNA-binding MarR family transcriptional regulator
MPGRSSRHGAKADSPAVDSDARIELTGAFLSELREFSLALTEMVELAQGDRFSSNAEVFILISLELDGPTRPNSLASAAGLSTGGMTNLLDRLEAAGLVERAGAVIDDRRGVLIALTADGEAVVERTARAVSSAFSLARSLIDQWREMFVRLGLEVGTHRPIDGGRSSLEMIRTMAAIGSELRTAFANVFGPADPQPVTTFHVLWMAAADHGTRPRDIARAEHLSSAGTSDVLERLENVGLVERQRGLDGDGRSVTVTTTDHGRRSLDDAILAAVCAVEHVAHVIFPL